MPRPDGLAGTRAAVRYKEYVDAALAQAVAALGKANPQQLDVEQLKKLKTDVVISASHTNEML